MTTATKNSKGWVAGIFTAMAASLCCITPVLAFLGGAGGLASSFLWIEPFRPYLIGLTIAVFAFAWYQKLKLKKQAGCNCEAGNQKSFWQSKLFLGMVTVIAALLVAFPYYSAIFYQKPYAARVIPADKNNMATVQLTINGMDCEACTAHINGELFKVNGVIEANTFYKNAYAIIQFDSSKTSVHNLSRIVNTLGYSVTSSNLVKK